MKRSMAVKAKSWSEFAFSLPGPYTAVVNRRLDAIVRNRSLPLEDRFDAFLLRSSWGNFNEFACDRITKSQEPATPETPIEKIIIKPLGQVDFARIFGVSKQRISQVVQLRQDQGLMARREDLDNPGLLVPLTDPVKLPERKIKDTAVPWQSFSSAWDSQHPELIEEWKEAQAQAAPFLSKIERIRRQKLADFKAAQKAAAPRKVQHSADASEVTDSEDSPVKSPQLPGPKVLDSLDKKSDTPRTVSAPRSHGHGIDTRVRAENLKQVVDEEQLLSVGRSSSPESGTPPTDRPIPSYASENPFKPKIRDWLQSNVSIPGYPLEEPELDQIAATIQTGEQLEQFQEAAKRQKNPRGWRVFVKIAQQCEKQHEHYKSAAAGGEDQEDPLVKRIKEEAERRKSWPTN